MDEFLGIAPVRRARSAAREHLGLLVTQLAGDRHGTARAHPRSAHHDQRRGLVLDRSRQLGLQLGHRDAARAGHMAGGVFIGLTDVDHHRLVAIDALYGARCRQTGAAAALQHGPCQHAARNQGQQDQRPIFQQESHVQSPSRMKKDTASHDAKPRK